MQLEVLNLGGNRLVELERDYFESMNALKTLFLANNLIESFEDGVFDSLVKTVQKIDVRSNKLNESANVKLKHYCKLGVEMIF